jgi:prepilin signal peptidase PulO-like enzyme (type II secretory pathway)
MIIAVLLLLGLCFGSFTNALVWRLHEQTRSKSKKAAKELSITQGRSMCPDCRHQLGFWDLIPVISWLTLGGKCRYCHKPISFQYPLVELLTAAIFLFSYAVWPFGWEAVGIFQFAIWLVILVDFMALAIYDLRWQILPSKLIYPAIFLTAAEVVSLSVWQHDPKIILGAALGILCLAGLFYGLFQVSQGRWIGGGDVRLAVVIGLLVGGPLKAVLVLFLASLIGLLVALPSVIIKKATLTRRVAFGPFLIVATIIVYLFGGALVAWYKQRFLLL